MDSTVTAPSTYNLECPISNQWIISEKKLATLKDSTTNEKLETPWFKASNIPGVKYSLAIYPTGNTDAFRDNFMVYLQIQLGNETKIKADVKYTIESAEYTKKEKYEYEQSEGWGFPICKTTELFDPTNKFITDKKFTIKCEGILSVEREKLTTDENGINLDGESIGAKLWNNDDKDFIIKLGEDSIKVHKNVLAAQSPVFEAMFHHSSMKEANENQMDINDFSFKVVNFVIQLLYNRGASMDLNDKMGVLQFCDKFDITDLKTRIEASLIEDVSISNVCEIANCSILSNALKLEEKCVQFLSQCIKSRTPVIDIVILDKDNLLKAIKFACCTFSET